MDARRARSRRCSSCRWASCAPATSASACCVAASRSAPTSTSSARTSSGARRPDRGRPARAPPRRPGLSHGARRAEPRYNTQQVLDGVAGTRPQRLNVARIGLEDRRRRSALRACASATQQPRVEHARERPCPRPGNRRGAGRLGPSSRKKSAAASRPGPRRSGVGGSPEQPQQHGRCCPARSAATRSGRGRRSTLTARTLDSRRDAPASGASASQRARQGRAAAAAADRERPHAGGSRTTPKAQRLGVVLRHARTGGARSARPRRGRAGGG